MYGMNAQESKAYGVKFQARCIAPQSGEKQLTRFLIGTLSLRDENEIHLIQLSDDGSSVVCEALFGHEHEIWDLAACPHDPLLFSTVYASAGEYSAALWRMPGDRYSNNYLQLAAQLPGTKVPYRRMLWHPGSGVTDFISIDEDSIKVWDLKLPNTVEPKGTASAGSLQQFSTGAWCHLDPNLMAATSDSSISLWDLREMSKVGSIDNAHNMQIRDLDWSPKSDKVLLSCGDDFKLRIWDLRFPAHRCLVDLPGHSHWVWRARFNPFHEDLVLSGGSDSMVALWHVPSASSGSAISDLAATQKPSAWDTLKAGSEPKGPLDHLAATFVDFEESVYGVAWSTVDPWMFASLSYDGRVVVDMVPPAVRSQVGR